MKTPIEEAIEEIRKMSDDKEVTFNFGLTTAIEILNNKLPKEREQIEGFAEWKVGLLTKQVENEYKEIMSKEAKDKAEELIHKFDIMQTYISEFSYNDAKDCALILVNEILNSIYEIFSEKQYIKSKDFYEQVKQEILNRQ